MKPATNVKTISDLLSIAVRAEREAVKRYSQLAASMREGNNDSTADLFERMAVEEEKHEQLLLEWMAREGIEENPDIDAISWHDPNISTHYNNEARDPLYSSPYKALAFAVRNEEIAFRFYSHVMAHSEDETVRKYAEILAKEELEHMALLKAERRRAYHVERDNSKTEPRLDPKTIHNETDLLVAAIHIDQFILNEIDENIKKSPEIAPLASEIQQEIDNNENLLLDRPPEEKLPGEDLSRSLEALKSYFDNLEEGDSTHDRKVQKLYGYCDRSFAFYNAVVEMAPDEAVMLTAQRLTSLALERTRILNNVASPE